MALYASVKLSKHIFDMSMYIGTYYILSFFNETAINMYSLMLTRKPAQTQRNTYTPMGTIIHHKLGDFLKFSNMWWIIVIFRKEN